MPSCRTRAANASDGAMDDTSPRIATGKRKSRRPASCMTMRRGLTPLPNAGWSYRVLALAALPARIARRPLGGGESDACERLTTNARTGPHGSGDRRGVGHGSSGNSCFEPVGCRERFGNELADCIAVRRQPRADPSVSCWAAADFCLHVAEFFAPADAGPLRWPWGNPAASSKSTLVCNYKAVAKEWLVEEARPARRGERRRGTR